MFLDTIVAKRVETLEIAKDKLPLIQLIKEVNSLERKTISFCGNLRQEKMGLIAEIKKASPSKGEIALNFDPVSLAKSYEMGAADGISVLTEPHYFKGSYEHLKGVRNYTTKPILNKDFIIDEWQIYQARAIGADLVLLIVAILSGEQLKTYYDLARSLGLEVLVEVHTEEELDRALGLKAELIGINNRNLKTFEVDIIRTLEMMKHIPKGQLVLSESGITCSAEVALLQEAGVSGILVGEQLVKAADPMREIQKLMGRK